ncbi:MAG: flagellar filament capping protein FliD [Bacillota bacterium]
MTSISSLSGSTSSSFDGTISGLASGMDTDSIIEAMLSTTQAKIDQALKDQTALEWEMEAYRDLIDKLQDFSNTFISLSSGSSLYSESYFENSLVEVVGEFSDLVKVTGNVEADFVIEQVVQLAKDSQIVSDTQMSDGTITTGDVTLGDKDVSLIEGETMTFTYGGVNYEVTLGAGVHYEDGSAVEGTVAQNTMDVALALQEALESVTVSGSTTLADLIDVFTSTDATTGETTLSFARAYDAEEEYDIADIQDLKLSAASAGITEILGLGEKTGNTTTDETGTIIGKNLNYEIEDGEVVGAIEVSAVNPMAEDGISELQSFTERIDGKSLTFSYNGSNYNVVVDISAGTGDTDEEKFTTALQAAIDRQIGTNRIQVSYEYTDANGDVTTDSSNGTAQFTFETVMIEKDDDGNTVYTDSPTNSIASVVTDNNSSLTISGDSSFFGSTGEFGISSGTSNKVNVYQPISGSIYDGLDAMGFYDTTGFKTEDMLYDQVSTDTDGNPMYKLDHSNVSYDDWDFATFTVNGVEINLLGDITKESGIEVMYNEGTGEWEPIIDYYNDADGNLVGETRPTEYWTFSDGSIVSAEEIEKRLAALTVDDIMQAVNDSDANVTMSYNSGSDKFTMVSNVGGEGGTITMDTAFQKLFFGEAEVQAGQDSIIVVDYDGEGGADSVTITRSSNSITIGDATITVSGTFDATNDGGVTATGSVNTDAIADSVEEMVNAYNELIAYINTELTTKPDSSYEPLSDSEKALMSDSEIALWEEKAKTGLLYGDTDLMSLASELRSIFFETGEFSYTFAEIGITTSSDYTENGKLTFNRATFEAALEKDPSTIQEMFTTTETSDGSAAGSTFGSAIGIMEKFKTVLDKYAGTTGEYKGVFIEKAGHSSSPLSLLDNELQDAYDAIDEILESLKTRLETERERYTSQFTALEVYISQMNAQSSWLYDQM